METRMVGRQAIVAGAAWLLFASGELLAEPSRHEPRAVAPVPSSAPPAATRQIIVKLRGVPAGAGLGARTAGDASREALSRTAAAAGLATTRFRRLLSRPPGDLDAERLRATAASGRELADLNQYYLIDVPGGPSAAELLARLSRLPNVEHAEPAPLASPPPALGDAATPDLVPLQGYRASPPSGVGTLAAAQVPGGDGAGMRLVDVEYDWIFDHEDLDLPLTANIDSAEIADPFQGVQADHGAAVLGVIGARENGLGMTGLAPAATLLVAPAQTREFGYNLARAISLATARLSPGDVLLLEQQTPVCGTGAFGPPEWTQAVFDAVATATALGIIVIEPAGNGPADLDAAGCGGRFDRGQRDSRAILVGAGDPVSRSRIVPSAFGSRVDVQGWGSAVASTGFGDAFDSGDVHRRYTNNFSGTSSAAAMVAGAVLAIQGALKAEGLTLARPLEMRVALVAGGTPQTGTAKVGPLPNVAAALAWLRARRAKPSGWGDWESYGGVLAAGEPDCLPMSPTRLDCWAQAAAGRLTWWRSDRSGTIPPPVDLAGNVSSAASCLQASGAVHCFVADPTRGLAHAMYKDGRWRGWIARGSATAARPACLSVDGLAIDCVVTTVTGRLRHRGIANGLWGEWRTLATTPLFREAPTCYARAGGIECLVVATTGQVFHLRRAANGVWGNPQGLSGNVRGRAACVRTGTTPICFFRGADQRLKRIAFDGTRWGTWSDFGGSLAGDPECLLQGETALRCWAATPGGELAQWSRSRTSGPTWENLGGAITAARPACVADDLGGIDCFVPGIQGPLQHLAYR